MLPTAPKSLDPSKGLRASPSTSLGGKANDGQVGSDLRVADDLIAILGGVTANKDKKGGAKSSGASASGGAARSSGASDIQGDSLDAMVARNHTFYLCEPIDIEKITRSAIAHDSKIREERGAGKVLSDLYRYADGDGVSNSCLRYNSGSGNFVYIGGAVNTDEGLSSEQTFSQPLKMSFAEVENIKNCPGFARLNPPGAAAIESQQIKFLFPLRVGVGHYNLLEIVQKSHSHEAGPCEFEIRRIDTSGLTLDTSSYKGLIEDAIDKSFPENEVRFEYVESDLRLDNGFQSGMNCGDVIAMWTSALALGEDKISDILPDVVEKGNLKKYTSQLVYYYQSPLDRSSFAQISRSSMVRTEVIRAEHQSRGASIADIYKAIEDKKEQAILYDIILNFQLIDSSDLPGANKNAHMYLKYNADILARNFGNLAFHDSDQIMQTIESQGSCELRPISDNVNQVKFKELSELPKLTAGRIREIIEKARQDSTERGLTVDIGGAVDILQFKAPDRSADPDQAEIAIIRGESKNPQSDIVKIADELKFINLISSAVPQLQDDNGILFKLDNPLDALFVQGYINKHFSSEEMQLCVMEGSMVAIPGYLIDLIDIDKPEVPPQISEFLAILRTESSLDLSPAVPADQDAKKEALDLGKIDESCQSIIALSLVLSDLIKGESAGKYFDIDKLKGKLRLEKIDCEDVTVDLGDGTTRQYVKVFLDSEDTSSETPYVVYVNPGDIDKEGAFEFSFRPQDLDTESHKVLTEDVSKAIIKDLNDGYEMNLVKGEILQIDGDTKFTRRGLLSIASTNGTRKMMQGEDTSNQTMLVLEGPHQMPTSSPAPAPSELLQLQQASALEKSLTR